MERLSFEVANEAGLHARPASELVACALRYASSITLSAHGASCDAKSIFSVLALDVTRGDRVIVTCEGPDEREARYALEELSRTL